MGEKYDADDRPDLGITDPLWAKDRQGVEQGSSVKWVPYMHSNRTSVYRGLTPWDTERNQLPREGVLSRSVHTSR